MRHDPIASGKRKSVNLSIDTGIVASAREHGLNLSQISEAALREATRQERARRWRHDNREWIADFSLWYEAEGDPLAHLELP